MPKTRGSKTESKQQSSTKVPFEVEELAEQIGSFIEFWGFKKVHGQIWCHLFLSRVPLDAAALMARLGISKALVSMSLRELVEFGVIEEAGLSERRTRVYTAVDDVTAPIVATLRRRERRMIANIQAAFDLLSSIPSEEQKSIGLDPNRLSYLGQLIRIAQRGLDVFIKMKWDALGELLNLKVRFFAGRGGKRGKRRP